ncbi:MAG: hypothetical protein CL927_07790 [Deltaproteobacteria bacterium]|nr:hypothetical protein [Deltaproteobacteria bacterium]HCH62106.1 hypothetical protein [Deltaproteobacteria bacterium]
MSLVSLPVFGFLVATVLLYWGVPGRGRVWVLLAAGALFAVGQATIFLPLYVLLAGVTWVVAGRLAARRRVGRSIRVGFVAMLSVLVVNLLAWKVFEIPAHTAIAAAPELSRLAFPGYADIFIPVGLSFLSFRLIHVLVERTRGRRPEFRAAPVSYLLAYLFFPPLWIAGPLQRFEDFSRQLRAARRPGLAELNHAAIRITSGLVKKLLVADALGRWAQPLLLQPDTTDPVTLACAVYAASLQLYMDFSGYSDIAIGLGRLFGIQVPENFDWPILATDIATFWRKWHITLHTFFRDYVFLPLFGTRPRPWKTYLGFMVTIFLFQIWHQLSWTFLFLGLFHGVGVVGVHAWRSTRRRAPTLHRWVARTPTPLAIWITFTWFSIGNIVFMTDPMQMWTVLARLLCL